MNQTNEPVAYLIKHYLNDNKDTLDFYKKDHEHFTNIPLGIIEPDTVTIPSAEYAKLKEDAAESTAKIAQMQAKNEVLSNALDEIRIYAGYIGSSYFSNKAEEALAKVKDVK